MAKWKRVLPKIFTNEFAIMCSWTGQEKNNKFKIGDSELIKIIKSNFYTQFLIHIIIHLFCTSCLFLLEAIKDSCMPNIFTDMEFEKIVSDWLRYANTRFQRFQNKNIILPIS